MITKGNNQQEEVLRKFLVGIDKAALNFLDLTTPEQTYQAIVQEALRLLHAEYGTILLYQQGELKRVYANHEIIAASSVRKRGRAYQAFKLKQPFIAKVESASDINKRQLILYIKSIIFIPLTYHNKSIGVLNILSTQEEQLSEDQLSMLKLYGSLACLAINKSKSFMETKSALESRELFIRMAAHEFKTPLTSVYGYIHLIKQYVNRGDLPKKDWIDSMTSEVTRLIKLIQELFHIETIEDPFSLKLKRLCLKQVLNQAVEDFRVIYPERKIEVDLQLSVENDIIYGDRNRILQMLINILNNAIKFSEPDSKVILKAKRITRKIQIIIQDFGQGIPKKELDKIFDKFYRGSGHSREGMGLGLFLAKEIIQKHHGIIHIKSAVNIGTTIKITLPAYKE